MQSALLTRRFEESVLVLLNQLQLHNVPAHDTSLDVKILFLSKYAVFQHKFMHNSFSM